MNKKMMYYKPPPMPRSTSKQQISSKPPKPKPEWTTDFGDAEKYKLTQTEMIQKKAALQSANMQQAKQQLAERRRKLEEGVIDDETRKIYQTALTSKRIDPNPSIRRNLSQMINYQRDFLSQSQRSTSKRRSVQQVSVEEELKNTKDFIRKMQRASKAKDVIRAVQILEEKPKYSQASRFSRSDEDISEVRKLTPLQNIEDTIKFMEERLFKPKQPQLPTAVPNITIQQPNNVEQEELRSSRTFNKIQNIANSSASLEISHIPRQDYRQNSVQSPIKDKGEDQDDWLNTIRRMNHLIDNQQRKYESEIDRNYEYLVDQPAKSSSKNEDLGYVRQQLNYEYGSFQDENRNTMNIPTDRRVEEQVDFSLTIYNENSLRIDTDQFFEPLPVSFQSTNRKNGLSPGVIKNTSRVTLQVSRLTSFDRPLVQEIEPNDDQGTQQYLDQPSLSFQQIKFTNEVVRSIKPKSKVTGGSSRPNPEAQRIKRLLDDTKRNLDNVTLTKLQLPSSSCSQNSGISLKRLAM